jgi:hypothetical protein
VLSDDSAPADAITVAGRLPALAAWATGRLPQLRRGDALTWKGADPFAALP